MILCAGEALIDMLPRQTAAGEDAFRPVAGGAVFNTAIALGRLGAPAGMLTGLSTDFFGDILTDTLDASNVDHGLAVRADRPTTLAFVRLVDGHASYAFYDEGTAGRMLTADALPDLPDHVTAVFFGGISLMAEPCGTAYETLMRRAADAGRVTMLDPNIRPSFIRDVAAYREKIARMIAMADIVKLSDEDLAWFGGTGTPAEQVRAMMDGGPSLVCITEGARGVTGHTPGGEVFVRARRAEVVDTVGAGDTFNAGVLASLHAAGLLTKDRVRALPSAAVEAALDLGARAAAVTVARAGANPPWAEELG